MGSCIYHHFLARQQLSAVFHRVTADIEYRHNIQSFVVIIQVIRVDAISVSAFNRNPSSTIRHAASLTNSIVFPRGLILVRT
jgi:hypothetical protein